MKTELATFPRISIRPLRRSDLCQVSSIEQTVASDPWSLEMFESQFDVYAHGRYWLAAQSSGRVIGYGGLTLAAGDAHLLNIGVFPPAQRQGTGRQLLAALLLRAVESGAVNATLEVRPSNVAALALYKRFGFSAAGTRPNCYQDGGDALIMWAKRIVEPEYVLSLTEMGRPA